MFRKGLFLLSALMFMAFVLPMGSSADCPAGWTFIDKAQYNFCYLPHVNQTKNINITDNNNNTLLSYEDDSHTDIANAINRDYHINISELRNYNGTDYLYFSGKAIDNNQTMRGMFYLQDDYIFIVFEKDLFANNTGSMRHIYNTFLVDSYQRMNNGTITTNNVAGNAAIITAYNTIRHITKSPALVNFTISGQYYKMTLNKTYESSKTNVNNINISVSTPVNSTDFFTANQGGMNEIRANNQTFIRNSIVVQQETATQFTRYGAGIIISFNDSHFTVGSELSNNTANAFYEGLTGFQYYATSCATGFGIIQHSCTPWRARTLLTNNYLLKVLQASIYDSVGSLKNSHLSLLFFNAKSTNRTFMQDYSFDPPNLQGVTNNALNNTHTRLVADYLIYLMNKETKTQADNNTISGLIYHLENTYFLSNNTQQEIITHSTNTKSWYNRDFTVNTNSIGTSALLTAKRMGYPVNSTLVDRLVNNSISAYSLLFNETIGNSSYYAISGDGIYFSTPRYGNSIYIILEMQDYLFFYIDTKNETAHSIFNRKLTELRNNFNGTSFNCPLNECRDNFSVASEVYMRTKAHYQNLSLTAFDNTGSLGTTTTLTAQPYHNWDKIPDGLKFTTVYYPIFVGENNLTYFVDQEDNLEFVTPAYAMIPDFKYDSSQKGMSIWNKWAYNVTNGNFTNLSVSPYQYIYSPQHARFINYTERLNFTATDDARQYWTGNISSSTTFRLEEGYGANFSIDSVNLGQFSPLNVSGTSTSKTITSQLSQAITATVVVNVEQCPISATYEDETVTSISCFGSQAIFELEDIPSGDSFLEFLYGCTSSGVRGVLSITILLASLAIIGVTLSIVYVKRKELTVKHFIFIFVAISAAIALWMGVSDSINTICPT